MGADSFLDSTESKNMKKPMQSDKPQEILYQRNPLKEKRNRYRLPSGQLAKETGWTDSLASYEYEANKLTRCLEINRNLAKSNYTWFVTINVRTYMNPAEIQAFWTNAKEKLRHKGLVALWVLEFTLKSKAHYHLLVRSSHTKRELEKLIESSLPKRSVVAWHKRILTVEKAPANQPDRLLFYITKARLAIHTKAGVKPNHDRYASQRRLPKPRLGLRKFGNIGPFWVKRKAAIWDEVVAIENRISYGLSQAGVAALADHVYEFLGTGNDVIKLEQLRRKFGYQWDSHWVQQWITQVFGKENSPTAKSVV